MVANISNLPLSLMKEFAVISASDPRACMIVNSVGIVQSINSPVKKNLPDAVIGADLKSLCADPGSLETFLLLCARTRGPLPGKIILKGTEGQKTEWNCHGGLAGHAADGMTLIILRLQTVELGRSAFEKLNKEIEALNAELEWRARGDQATAHLAAIVSSSTDAIYGKDLNKIVTSWNRGAELMFGYSAEEIVGASISPVVPTDKRAEEDKLLEKLRSGKTLAPVETVRQTKDGRLIDVSITSSPIVNRGGEIVGYSKIVRDISARKKIERSLLAANATFEHLIDRSPFGIYAVDADFRIAQVSAGAQKAFENVRPLIGRDFSEAMRILWPAPACEEFIQLFRHTLETGEAYHAPTLVETRYDTSELESYDWKIERLTLRDGRLGVVCHFYDLSERERFEAELRESEQRFRGTFENTSVGIAHVSLDGEWLELNDQLCKILGYERAEVLDKSLSAIRHPDDRAAHSARLASLIAGKRPNFQSEERFIRKDGTLVWVGVSGDLQKSEIDDQAYLIYVVRDITKRKTSQEHQDFLMHELAHRSKNQLAIISAMARQTAKNATSIKDFQALFDQRLHGLAVSIDLLIKRGWTGVALGRLIDMQLEAFKGDGSRLKCDGPEIVVNGVAAEAIGLALHELSTNCLKYGAWSVPTGKVMVSWDLEPAKNPKFLRIKWLERGGPAVVKPTHKGFGQMVIENLVAQKLKADVKLDYSAKGFSWTLLLPCSHLIST